MPAKTRAAVDLPTPDDFHSDNEVLVWPTPGEKLDSAGRIQFTAFWLDENTPHGVRGQVFNTVLADFTERNQAAGHPVRVLA